MMVIPPAVLPADSGGGALFGGAFRVVPSCDHGALSSALSTAAVELVSMLMPARPALLIPAVGAGLAKLAEGVTSMGPPNVAGVEIKGFNCMGTTVG